MFLFAGPDIARRDHAKAVFRTFEAVGFSVVMGALSPDRPQAERQKITSMFSKKHEQNMLTVADQLGMGFCTFHVDIHKA